MEAFLIPQKEKMSLLKNHTCHGSNNLKFLISSLQKCTNIMTKDLSYSVIEDKGEAMTFGTMTHPNTKTFLRVFQLI